MALPKFLLAFTFALALANIQLVTCDDVVKGSVSCVDCSKDYDFSGIRVLIKCDKVKKLAAATTGKNGAFKAKLPLTDAKTSGAAAASPKCLAKLLGGPKQLYASKKNMVSEIVKDQELDAYTVSTPLVFASSCSSTSGKVGKCGKRDMEFGTSKTFDLPIPPEYGFPPTSLYMPIFPIIGIP